jgi:hypothetical protein
MPTILTGFLTANLLPIGEDDEKLKLLEDAAGDLAKDIKSTPLLAYRLAMVSLDERVPASDPVHKRVGAVISSKWQTMTNKTGAGPVQVHRAVMLRAIEIAAAENSDLRFAMTLVARNQPARSTSGKAADAIEALFASWEADAAREMSETWVNPVDMSLPKLTSKVKKSQVGKEDLALGLARSVGPQEKEGKALVSPNPHWPNQGQPWAYEFVGRATDAIHAAIQAGAKGFAEDMQDAVRESILAWASSLEQLAVRDAKAELLWIRASMYSPSAAAAYKSLDANRVLLHAVLDASRAVTRLAPPSVEYFLRDLVEDLVSKRARLADVLADIGPRLAVLPEGQIVRAEPFPPEGRRSWLDYAVRNSDANSFADEIGVADDYKDQVADLAVRLYRELQIRKLLTPAA